MEKFLIAVLLTVSSHLVYAEKTAHDPINKELLRKADYAERVGFRRITTDREAGVAKLKEAAELRSLAGVKKEKK